MTRASDVGDGGAFFVGELVEVGEACVDVAAGCVEGAALGVVDEQVVDGEVEGLGHADDGFEAGGDLVVLVAGDLAGVGVDLGGELGLGPAGFGAQRLEAVAVEGAGHLVSSADPLAALTPVPGLDWNHEAMTTHTHQQRRPRWVLLFLAALVTALTIVGLAGTASVASGPTAETRVGAFSVAVEVAVGPPEGIPAGQRLGNDVAGPRFVVAIGVAAKTGDDFVNLASEARTSHILDGHMPPGLPGKSLFPKSWSSQQIMQNASDIATDPSLKWVQQTGKAGPNSPRMEIQSGSSSTACEAA